MRDAAAAAAAAAAAGETAAAAAATGDRDTARDAASAAAAAAAASAAAAAAALAERVDGRTARRLGLDLAAKQKEVERLVRRSRKLLLRCVEGRRACAGPLEARLLNVHLERRAKKLEEGLRGDLAKARVEVPSEEEAMPAHPVTADGVLAADELAAKVAADITAYTKLIGAAKSEHCAARALRLQALESRNDDSAAEAYFDAAEAEAPTRKIKPDSNKVYLRMPESEFLALVEDDGDSVERYFYHADVVKTPAGAGAETRYQSMKAKAVAHSPSGTEASLESIVDSGAAYCGVARATLVGKLGWPASAIRPTRLRFRDASGNLMPVCGWVMMPLTMGRIKITARVYVFESLHADLLLGANAIHANKLVIDAWAGLLYISGHPEEHAALKVMPDGCPRSSDDLAVCEADGCSCRSQVNLAFRGKDMLAVSTSECEEELQCSPAPMAPPRRPKKAARLILDEDATIEPGDTATLRCSMQRRTKGLNATLVVPDSLASQGLSSYDEIVVNPVSDTFPLQLYNGGSRAVHLGKGRVVGQEYDARPPPGREVLLAGVLKEPEEGKPRPLDEGGREDLHELGFTLEHAVDPEKRRPDGSYEPLAAARKEELYRIAHRWWYVWSRDAKAPQLSYLVVIDIPTGDAEPIAQGPYPIPAKLRAAAMKEVNKLLRAGLIEPSMSNWASPAMVRLKKDSTPDEIKLKFAIDYRRLNAVTRPDAGGLGTQSDILYGLGGRFRWIGLCDAAGGFYQFALRPEARHKSAFILPASMGGTLFEWRVAPYGLTRNPAGYSRGMQFVLKGLADCHDLGVQADLRGGASSWLDDICMKSDSFEGFAAIFGVVLSRLAAAGMTLKGSKCELLLASMDLLGFRATPHGLQMQQPKLDDLTVAPSTPSEIRTFLGAVAFYRRFVPRLSMLQVPMTAVIKASEKIEGRAKQRGRLRGGGYIMSAEEQQGVFEAWQAITAHLSSDAVVASPDFDDPLAEFVLTPDASDVAVGGCLMQWQHESGRGPGPPAGQDVRGLTSKDDPIQNSWRIAAGWELKVIGYYSKTLNDAQKKYTAFDKEAAAILLCVRHWADLITYHPTSVYTDSAVAVSMLTKHMAPPRLQRWGMEIGTFLPFLRIAHRKGVANGIADLLSRFPTFRKYVRAPAEEIELPGDLFDFIGDAPLFTHKLGGTKSSHLVNASYRLYESKRGAAMPPESFWTNTGAPEIPGRGMKDRFVADVEEKVASSRGGDSLAAVMECVADEALGEADRSPASPWLRYVRVFLSTKGERPKVSVACDDAERASDLCTLLSTSGFCVVPALEAADVRIEAARHSATAPGSWSAMRAASPGATEYSTRLRLRGGDARVTSDVPLDDVASRTACGKHAPELPLVESAARLVAATLHADYGMPVWHPSRLSSLLDLVLRSWEVDGYLGVVLPSRLENVAAVDAASSGDEQDGDGEGAAARDEGQTRAEADASGQAFYADHAQAMPEGGITGEHQWLDPELRRVMRILGGELRVDKARRGRVADDWEMVDDVLHRRTTNENGESVSVVAVPQQLRAAVLAYHHYPISTGGGHSGGKPLYGAVRDSFYWSGMPEDCDVFAAACRHCGETRSQASLHVPMATAATPRRPFEVLHVDHKGPLRREGKYVHILVVVCALTRFTLYIPVSSTSGSDTLDSLITHVFSVFGVPLVIIADNGPALANRLTKAAQELFGFRCIFVKPATPQANGLAEAAVKRIKLILDRHTDHHEGWPKILPMAQMLLNSKSHAAHGLSPFTALFGRVPIRLPAVENPTLLPDSVSGADYLRDVVSRLRILHERLADESDLIKRAAVNAFNAKHPGPVHDIMPGDYVWLTPGSEERAAYVRRHGHGDPWRFPFKVEQVKPHAVRLALPKDGSVPDITAWQSLRKCSRSRPVLHDGDLPLPEIDSHGRVVIRLEGTAAPDPEPSVDADAPAEERYEVERIVRAERRGRGWSLYVKWAGFPDVTCEPLSRLTRDTQHPDILAQIKASQDAYDLEHPVHELEPEAPRPEPTRVQPSRAGVRRAADVALVYACTLCERRSAALEALLLDASPSIDVL